MTNRQSQKRSSAKQNTESTLTRRTLRQKRVQRILEILGFSSAGIGITAIIHFAENGEVNTAIIVGIVTFAVTVIAIAAKFISELLNSILDKIEEKLEYQKEPLAIWIVNRLENWLLKLWWTLTSDFKGKYYQQLEYTCRDYLTQGLDKDKILKLQKVFIPLKIATKDARSVDPKMIQTVYDQAENLKEKSIWDFLAAMKYEPAFRRMVILGAPGSGKTTLLRYITLTYATNTQGKVHRQAPKLIPILLYLRDIRQDIANNKPPLEDLIVNQINQLRIIEPLNPPQNWFQDRLKNNQCLVMLDGLDEVVNTKQVKQVRDWVDEQIQQYPNTSFILTSRPHDYKDAPLQHEVITLEVRPFSLKQMQQFLRNWYLQTEIMSRAGENDLGVQEEARQNADDLIERICNSKPLVDMAVNPLLLNMIATVHRRGNILPGKRVELYKEICQVLLETRQRAKNIPNLLTATQKQSVLQLLALVLMTNDTREFKLSDPIFLFLIQNELKKVTRKILPEAFIQQIKDVCGLIVEKRLGVYEFVHFSFQEFLAAVEIKESNQEDILINNLNNLWWHETIRLYVAQSDATNIIRAALANPTVDSMALTYDCLDEARSIDVQLRDKLEARLEADLESRNELLNLVDRTKTQSSLFKKILKDLRQTSSMDLSKFSDFSDLLKTKKQRHLIFNQFRQDYNFINLIFTSQKEKIEVSEKERMNSFRKIWNTIYSVLNQSNMEDFRSNADQLTQLFCHSLGFKILDNLCTLGQFYGRMIDASNPAFQLDIPPIFPLIYVCKTTSNEKDPLKIHGLINQFGIYADFFALLIVFDNYQAIREQVRKSAYKNDFIVLNYDQLWDILAAKSPVQQLTNYILEQIDLVAISPYTVYGPVTEKMFFGRAKEEKTLLQNINRNDYALIANRKTGKSSLLNRIYPRLKSIPNNQVYYSDLQTVNNYDLFYEELAFSYPEFEEEISKFSEFSPSSFRKLIRNIKQRYSNQNIIFIFDEVDEFLAYDIQNQEQLFKTFRSLSQRENIHFIFSGTTTLVKRIRNPNSPLFNFCSPIIIGILEKKDAEELVREPMKTLGVKFENEAAIVEQILKLSAQHPNLIQYICDALIKIINQKQERKITVRDLDKISESQEFYEYFETIIWGQSTALEKLIIYTMWSYSEFSESEVIENFKQKGIAEKDVKASLEVLLTYSTLSRKNDKYFFTFQEFAKLMDKRRDIQALTEQYQREVESSKS